MPRTSSQQTQNGRIKKIDKICRAILKLEEEDFQAVQEMADRQSDYLHPLKMGTAQKMHRLGDHNTRVLKGIRELKSTIEGLKK